MKKKFATLLALLLSALPALGGLSLVLVPGAKSTAVNDPANGDVSWRVEFQLHDWADPTVNTGDAFVWDLNGIGASASVLTGGTLRFIDKRDSTVPSTCDLKISGRSNILVRVQRDIATSTFLCEAWNHDGTGYLQSSLRIGAHQNWNFSGGAFGSAYTTARLGFFRVLGTILRAGGKPPTTATTETASTSLKFDGNVQDNSGNGRNVTFPATQFANTPNQIAAAIPRTDGAPAWSSWVSVRAGFPATLDATASFSLADGGNSVNYRWQQLSGPTTLRWSDRSSPKPVIRGLIFGTYRVRLQVTDTASGTGVADLDFGAVATDDNGVVVHANPDADKIFGPMIAFGRNPWPWADQMALRSATVRKTKLDTISPPGWGINLPGTVSYTPGAANGPIQTTLAAAVTASGMALTVSDAGKLDLGSLPTVIMLHAPNTFNPIEEVVVCASSGNTLTLCYDGRAWRRGLYERVTGPQAWPAGTVVRQVKTSGAGTQFLTDFCAAGPGEPGMVETSAGTVSVVPNSTTLVGSGTAWTSSLQSLRIRIAGTHSGQPFAFFAQVLTVGSAGSVTLSRPWPADADAASGLTYAILQPARYMARGWVRPDATSGRNSAGISSCTGDTQIYHTDALTSTSGTQTEQPFGYLTSSWFSEFGPNYYDEVLAHYAGFLRSGYSLFRDNARKIGDFLPTSPDFDEGWAGQLPRRVGATGMVVGAVLDGRVNNWYTLRRLANSAITNPYSGGAVVSSCNSDVRETAYALSWLALAAMLDPVDTGSPTEPNQRSYWRAHLAGALARDRGCKGTNNEFPQPYWSGSGSFTVTKGSATVKGSNIPQSRCAASARGTINVTNGVVSATGSGFVSGAKIVVLGRRLGQPYLFYTQFSTSSPNSLAFSSPYDGDSGTYSYQIESDLAWLAFARDGSDYANMNTLYTCQWTDASTIELDRPWEGASGVVQSYRFHELGFGQIPFLTGIKVFAMKLASLAASGDTATGYAELAAATAEWILNTGFDPVTGGLHYARGWPGCEPKLNPRLNCSYGPTPGDMERSRTLNAEAQNALRVAYEANPTDETRRFGDQFYGAQWGKLGGPYSDGVYLSALDNDATWDYKWVGFLFGIGMSHQWPAVRLGGVRPEVPLTSVVSFNTGSAPGSASARIRVTRPSGAEAVYSCAATPCQVQLDARQGAHWYRVEYLDSRGAVVSVGSPDILEVR